MNAREFIKHQPNSKHIVKYGDSVITISLVRGLIAVNGKIVSKEFAQFLIEQIENYIATSQDTIK